MNMKSFATYMGLNEDCFEGVDLFMLPDYDKTKTDCDNMLALYLCAKGHLVENRPSDAAGRLKLERIAFESAYQVIGMIEIAQEQVDCGILQWVYDNAQTAKSVCSAYLTVAQGYLNGFFIAFDCAKAGACIAEAQAILCRFS